MKTSLTTPSSHTACVVVVEDSDEDFDTLLEAARAAGITQTIHRTISGGDCLALLNGEPVSPQVSMPNLPTFILMDLNSHGVDGREALTAIKSQACLKEIPLVVLTTSANPKDVAFCYQAGANAYHVKPVRHDHYRQMLCSLLVYWLNSVSPHTSKMKFP